MAMGLQREQHGQCRHMGVMVAVTVAAMVMIVGIVVVAMVAAMAASAIVRLAFIQLERLAHTDVVFAHV
jgi:hypothetical protein